MFRAVKYGMFPHTPLSFSLFTLPVILLQRILIFIMLNHRPKVQPINADAEQEKKTKSKNSRIDEMCNFNHSCDPLVALGA